VIDRTSPNPGPVAHVFVDPDGGGVCVCGAARFTSVHVAYDGTPEADLTGILDALDTIDRATATARRIIGGGP